MFVEHVTKRQRQYGEKEMGRGLQGKMKVVGDGVVVAEVDQIRYKRQEVEIMQLQT